MSAIPHDPSPGSDSQPGLGCWFHGEPRPGLHLSVSSLALDVLGWALPSPSILSLILDQCDVGLVTTTTLLFPRAWWLLVGWSPGSLVSFRDDTGNLFCLAVTGAPWLIIIIPQGALEGFEAQVPTIGTPNSLI